MCFSWPMGRMAVQYRTAPVRPGDLERGTLGVWTESLPTGGCMARKLAWFYDHAPAGPGQLWLLTASAKGGDPKPVGGMGFGLRDWQVGGHSVRAGVMADLAVVPAHRTVLPALTLTRTVVSGMRAEVELGYGFPGRSAVGVIRRSGYRDLGVPVRYVLALRYGRHLRKLLDSALAAGVASKPFDVARAALTSLRASRPARKLHLTWLSDVDARFNRLWERARHDYVVVGRRDAAFLAWRFLRHPWFTFRVAGVCPRDSEERIVGYAVVQQVDDVFHVRDLFAARADLGLVFDLLVADALRSGAASVSVQCLQQTVLSRLLEDRGLANRGTRSPVVVDPDCPAARSSPRVLEADSWYLTDADEDT